MSEVKSYNDNLAILVCQIKVWAATAPQWFIIPHITKCLYLHEIEDIEVFESYKELVGTCVLHIPRGTIVSKIQNEPGYVSVGNETDFIVEKDLKETTGMGDVMVPGAGMYDSGRHTTPIQAERDDVGIIQVKRGADAHILTPDDFAVGNRIQIRCGYVYGDQIDRANQILFEDNPSELKVIFTGIITGCSVTTPLEIECENMATLLKKKSCPNLIKKDDYKICDFLDDDKAFKLLKDTGIELADECKGSQVNVGRINFTTSVTVADVLNDWGKKNIVSYMVTDDNGSSKLKVGVAYYNSAPGNIYGNSSRMIIYDDWDVANDGLDVSRIDKQFLVIKAKGELTNGGMFSFALRKKPGSGSKTDSFEVVNLRKPCPKKKGKHKVGAKKGEKESVVDLSEYNCITYHPSRRYARYEDLVEEAKVYWKKYSANGVSGTLVIFGDKIVRPGDVIGYVSKRQPEKSGYYVVESVSTRFGVNGYRRELKIPYRLSELNMKEIR